MFYAQLLMSKRGSLAKVWLAAHWEKKLTRTHVFECNLDITIQDILSPKMKMGLRISGHLLLGVVRMYNRKAKYLLTDCSEAFVKIRVAFRPGQTDMPVEGQEAPRKSITLTEDFTDFESQLPLPNEVDIVDHFSMNQSRNEEITMKEDFGNSLLALMDIDESLCHHDDLLDMSLQNLEYQKDTFGDENTGFDLFDVISLSSDNGMLLGFNMERLLSEEPEMTSMNIDQSDIFNVDLNEADPSTLNETTLFSNAGACFALDPVAVSSTLEKKKGKRKSRLLIDQEKQLSNDFISKLLSDTSDLVGALDMAPPTRQLMHWRENGSVNAMFRKPCSMVIHPQIQQLFGKSIFQASSYGVAENTEPEQMRKDIQPVQEDRNDHTTEQLSNLEKSVNPQGMMSDAKMPFLSRIDEQLDSSSKLAQLQSTLNSQESQEQTPLRQAQKLLNTLKRQSNNNGSFSLNELCESSSRSQAAAIFFNFLVLKKQLAIQLHQSEPYEDITATLGPRFNEC